MSQSLTKNLLHLIFSTKYRRPSIPKQIRNRLFANQSGIFIFKRCQSPALIIGGVEDHIHSLFSL